MKNLRVLALVLLVVICNCTSLRAQIAMHNYKVFGGSKADQYPSLVKTNDGGFIIAFETESNDFDCIGNHGETDIAVIKVDANGNKVWSKCYGGGLNEGFGEAVIDNDGFIYLVGTARSLDGDLPNEGKGSADRWILKLDYSGNIIWSKVYGGSDADLGIWIGLKSNGNIITGGRSYSNDLEVGFNYGYDDSWIAEVDNAGGFLHSMVSGTTSSDRDWAGIVTKDGGFLGSIRVTQADGMVNGPSLGGYDLLFVKGDSLLGQEWQTLRGGSAFDGNLGDIIELPDGYLFIAATSSTDNDLENGGCQDEPNIEGDVWVCKLNKSGTVVWSRCIGVGSPEGTAGLAYQSALHGKSLFMTNDGGYMVFSHGFNVDCNPGSIAGSSIQVTKLDSLGYIVWQKSIGNFSGYINASFAPKEQGRWVAAVEAEAVSMNCETANQGYSETDIWLIDVRECEYYTTSKPEGDEKVCVLQTPTTQYATHPYWAVESYSWTIIPSNAGEVIGNDSIVTISWAANFTGEVKLVVNLSTECGISKPSDTLNIMVHSNCTFIEDLAEDNVKVYFQPNPADKVANLKYSLPEGLNQARVSLVDLEGKVVYKGLVSGSAGTLQVDVYNLRGGVYQCIVEGENARGRCRLVIL